MICCLIELCSILFSFLLVFITLWISLLLEHRSTSERYSSAWAKNDLKIKSCDVGQISLLFQGKAKCCVRQLLIPTQVLRVPVLWVAPSLSGYKVPTPVCFRTVER